jgi:hypothetical protein
MESTNKEETGKIAESIKSRFGSGSKAGNFFESMKNRMGIGDPERNASDTYECGQKIVPDSIKPNEGEIPVKQYNVAILRNLFKYERAEGRMQVTNKRVIFRAAGRSVGGRTTLQHEFAINEIAGIEAIRNYKFSIQYLVGAILIVCLSTFIITRGAAICSGNFPSPQNILTAGEYMMSPPHVRKAKMAESEAINQRKQAEENAKKAEDNRKEIQEIVDTNTERDRTNPRWTYWFRNQYRTPQAILDIVQPERDKAVQEESAANRELETAIGKESKAIKSRESTEVIWKIIMTLLGLAFGCGGLIPFFTLFKRFGLKLFILNFSIFGFSLSLAATGIFIFNWLRLLSVLITAVCVIIFCFRPNLVISIKNKMGSGNGPVDIRRNEYMSKMMGMAAFAIGFIPINIFWGANLINSVMGIFGSSLDDIAGGILASVIPIILIIIVLFAILRKNNDPGLDSGFAEVIPTEETEGAIREIGAIIGDIQKLGDSGIERWTRG